MLASERAGFADRVMSQDLPDWQPSSALGAPSRFRRRRRSRGQAPPIRGFTLSHSPSDGRGPVSSSARLRTRRHLALVAGRRIPRSRRASQGLCSTSTQPARICRVCLAADGGSLGYEEMAQGLINTNGTSSGSSGEESARAPGEDLKLAGTKKRLSFDRNLRPALLTATSNIRFEWYSSPDTVPGGCPYSKD